MESGYFVRINSGVLKGLELPVSMGVTYFVGKNGAGKTQFLESFKSGAAQLLYRGASGQEAYQPFFAYEWGASEFDDKVERGRDYRDINSHLIDVGQQALQEKEYAKLADSGRTDEGDKFKLQTLVTKHEIRGEEFDFSKLSRGTQRIFSRFRWRTNNSTRYPEGSNTLPNRVSAYVLLWDEPENHLHPQEQKRIPRRIVDWLSKTVASRGGSQPGLVGGGAIGKPTFVFVATHSPFVLSGSYALQDHRVVCLDDCKVESNSIEASQFEKRMIANRLIGAGMADFIPVRRIIAENSIAELLFAICKNLDIDIHDQVVTLGGDNQLITHIKSVSDAVQLMVGVQNRFPEKGYFTLDFIALTDDETVCEEIESIEKTEWTNVNGYALGHAELEDSYPLEWVNEFLAAESYSARWNPENGKFSNFLYQKLEIQKRDQGALKKRLAQFVGAKILNREDLHSHLPRVASFLTAYFSKSDIKL